jgi:hypothetical protein
LLSDAVVPVSCAVRGTPFGHELWDYKSGRTTGSTLRGLLLLFLHDHGSCAWRRAGTAGPVLLAVVPSGAGRQGPHPLLRMAVSCIRLPVVPLAIRHGQQGRDLNVERFFVPSAERPRLAGTDVLLLDDTWVSGASAQSAAACLKLAGATRVVTVVLARLLRAEDPRAAALAALPFDPLTCAVHDDLTD